MWLSMCGNGCARARPSSRLRALRTTASASTRALASARRRRRRSSWCATSKSSCASAIPLWWPCRARASWDGPITSTSLPRATKCRLPKRSWPASWARAWCARTTWQRRLRRSRGCGRTRSSAWDATCRWLHRPARNARASWPCSTRPSPSCARCPTRRSSTFPASTRANLPTSSIRIRSSTPWCCCARASRRRSCWVTSTPSRTALAACAPWRTARAPATWTFWTTSCTSWTPTCSLCRTPACSSATSW